MLLLLFLSFLTNDTLVIKLQLDIKKDFYKSAIASTNNDKIAVYDTGNKKVHLYDTELKELLVFGNEGNGPGEFSGNEHAITLTNDRIFVFGSRTQIYSLAGKHLRDIKGWSSNIDEFKNRNGTIDFFSGMYPHKKILGKRINKSGTIQQFFTNPIYKEETTKEFGNIVRIKNLYAVNERGEYAIRFYNSDSKLVKTFRRPFERFKADEDYFNLKGNVPQSQYKQALAMYMKESGGYKSDIKRLLTYKNYFIVSTETNSKKIVAFDIIDTEFKKVGSQKIEFKDNVTTFHIEDNRLIVSLKNDTDGPYVQIYSIEKN